MDHFLVGHMEFFYIGCSWPVCSILESQTAETHGDFRIKRVPSLWGSGFRGLGFRVGSMLFFGRAHTDERALTDKVVRRGERQAEHVLHCALAGSCMV